jgi:beta-ribofuranosylaminobenzene 5'-phosphate synthase
MQRAAPFESGRPAAASFNKTPGLERSIMERIIIQTPARLHIGLLDLNGEIGRIDGGIGLALESPHTTIEVFRAERIQVSCAAEPEIEGRLSAAVKTVCER